MVRLAHLRRVGTFSLKFTTAHKSRQNTVTKMTQVTVSTRNESAEIMSAGVDAGAKMLAGLSGRVAGFAHAAAAVYKIGTVFLIILKVATWPDSCTRTAICR